MGEGQPAMGCATFQAFCQHGLYPRGLSLPHLLGSPHPDSLMLTVSEVSLTMLSPLGNRVEGGTLLPKAKSDLRFQSNGEVIVGNTYMFLNVGLLWLFHLAELLKAFGIKTS